MLTSILGLFIIVICSAAIRFMRTLSVYRTITSCSWRNIKEKDEKVHKFMSNNPLLCTYFYNKSKADDEVEDGKWAGFRV